MVTISESIRHARGAAVAGGARRDRSQQRGVAWRPPGVGWRPRGFTLIELLVVMAVLATLLAVAAPRYFDHLERARENTLRQSLAVMRDAIDKFYADQERYPDSLVELVERRYLRSLPRDPVTERSDSWIELPPPGNELAGVADVRSGAPGAAIDGTPFAEL
jgi:general secretion pathway protein G